MNLRETIENQMANEVAEAKSDIKDDSYEIPSDKPNTSMDTAIADALFNKCDCHLYDNQVCDICQNWTGEEKDNERQPDTEN